MASVDDAGGDAGMVKPLRLICLVGASIGLGLLLHHVAYLWGLL